MAAEENPGAGGGEAAGNAHGGGGGGHGGGGKHKKGGHGGGEGHGEAVNLERWLVSYADFMTLLFCVFTVLYAMSIVDKAKITEVAKSVTKALGMGGPYEARMEASKDLDRGDIFDGTEGVLDKSGKDIFPDSTYKRVARRDRVETPSDFDYSGKGKDAKDREGKGEGGTAEGAAARYQRLKMEQVAGMVEKALLSTLDKKTAAKIAVEIVPGIGVRITLPSKMTFHSGEASILAEFIPTLKQMGEVIERIDNKVLIEGHTDNVPISSDRYPSNWELSTSRATAVLHFLLSTFKFDPRRFSAAGYGEYQPIDANDTDAGREKNRRAVIVILESDKKRPK
ncbi:MAG: OmpA family protein [Oligoflexia bacterium]|nr:OmpA family protein [Oligoflexia bacterium]